MPVATLPRTPDSFRVHVCSSEPSDVSLVQRFMNALSLELVDHIFLGVNKKTLSLCKFVASFRNFLLSELGS